MSMPCKDLGCLKEGMQIHGCVEKGRFEGNLVVRSALLSLYAKFGKMEDARLLFDSMKERDLVSWNIMIDEYTAVTSFGLFQLMLAEGNLHSCLSFIHISKRSSDSIWLDSFEMVSELHGFETKLDFGRSNVALIRSLIDAYAKCGSLSSALKLYEGTMKGDLISCTAIITGLAQQNNLTSDTYFMLCILRLELYILYIGYTLRKLKYFTRGVAQLLGAKESCHEFQFSACFLIRQRRSHHCIQIWRLYLGQ